MAIRDRDVTIKIKESTKKLLESQKIGITNNDRIKNLIAYYQDNQKVSIEPVPDSNSNDRVSIQSNE